MLIAGGSAHATDCELKHASFRPRFGPEQFVLRGLEEMSELRVELTLFQTGESYLFRIERSPRGEAMRLESLAPLGMPERAITAEFRMSNSAGKIVQEGPVRALSFLDLAQAFLRLEGGQRSNTPIPPSGLWLVSECRSP
jgi:hypothetical protein